MQKRKLSLATRLSALCGVLLLAGGCTSLPSLNEIDRDLIPGRWIPIDGQRVHVEEQGEGDPIFLIHGFGGSTYSWRSVMPELAESYRVIALDLNGFGFTERPRRLARYSRSGQLHLIQQVMTALEVESAHFIGHSYGGGIVMALAALHPERVRSLVVVDSTAPNWALARQSNLAELVPLTWLFVRSYALREANVRKALERSWFDDSLVTDEVVDAYFVRLRIAGAARAYRGLSTPTQAPEEERLVNFQDLSQPVLMIWGAEDSLIPVEDAELAHQSIPHGTLEVLEDCGHSPMEEQPEAFLRSVHRFLDRIGDGDEGQLAGR